MSFASETQEKIEVMQAFTQGRVIEYRGNSQEDWDDCPVPLWDWRSYEYRIKAYEPDQIDWQFISPRFQFCARDNDGEVYLFIERPVTGDDVWCGVEATQINRFWQGIFTKGDIPWNESLIERN